jgi:putative (di)nucleoside polyphosphate hydrolase
MNKTLPNTCGVIIVNNKKELLLAHSTGNKHWDIPKGMQHLDETTITAALRETQEETGLVFSPDNLIFVGKYPFRKCKNIVLYFISIPNIDLSKVHCSSFVYIEGKKPFPEMDDFKLYNLNESLKYMSRPLRNVFLTYNITSLIENKTKTI